MSITNRVRQVSPLPRGFVGRSGRGPVCSFIGRLHGSQFYVYCFVFRFGYPLAILPKAAENHSNTQGRANQADGFIGFFLALIILTLVAAFFLTLVFLNLGREPDACPAPLPVQD